MAKVVCHISLGFYKSLKPRFFDLILAEKSYSAVSFSHFFLPLWVIVQIFDLFVSHAPYILRDLFVKIFFYCCL